MYIYNKQSSEILNLVTLQRNLVKSSDELQGRMDWLSYKAQLVSATQCFSHSEIHDIAAQLMENNEQRNWQHSKLSQRSVIICILVRYENFPIQVVRCLITQTIRVQNCETKVSMPILDLIWITENDQAKKF